MSNKKMLWVDKEDTNEVYCSVCCGVTEFKYLYCPFCGRESDNPSLFTDDEEEDDLK